MAHILSSVSGDKPDLVQIKRCLVSVSDKTGVIDLCAALSARGVEILSTGGTAKHIANAGMSVVDVSQYTGSPEILDGRVKTLHPKVHGALLGVRGNALHEQQMSEHGIKPIDLVVMNLYPFQQTVASGKSYDDCVENIDIGGPSMMRSSAKNHAYVSILTNPAQYMGFLGEYMSHDGNVTLAYRKKLATAAFATSAAYDSQIASYFASQVDGASDMIQEVLGANSAVSTRVYKPEFNLKYGCNPQQKPAAIYAPLGKKLPFSVVNGTPGYINLLDACNAWQLVYELKQALNLPAAASFKHCSPAGAAVYHPLSESEKQAYEISAEKAAGLSNTAIAYIRARNADPMCSFGDFAAVSHVIDVSTANTFKTEVCDGIIAPGYEPEALEILKGKKKGAFIILEADESFTAPMEEFREVFGVTFSQKRNDAIVTPAMLANNVCKDGAPLSEEAKRDLVLASIAIKYTQSNSVGYAKSGQMIGVGAGQQSRVDCVKLAGRKVSTWWLRQHPKVQGLPFKESTKRQARVNARVRYIEGDITKAEYEQWIQNFTEAPEPLTDDEKSSFLATLDGVSLSSDAFFPFRDSIDHASKYGVQYIAQPGGSVADAEVIDACKEYGMDMAFTNTRLFHH